MIDIDTLSEAYSVMKEYVATKDRQAAADHIVGVLSDSGISDKDLKVFCGTDSYLQRALKEYINEEDLDDDYDDAEDSEY